MKITMSGDIKKISVSEMSKTSLRRMNEIMDSNPEMAIEIAEKRVIRLLLVKRYMHRGTIAKQSSVIASVKSF